MGDIFVKATKSSKTTIAILSIFFKLVHPCPFLNLLGLKFISSFNVLSGYFYVSFNFVTVSYV